MDVDLKKAVYFDIEVYPNWYYALFKYQDEEFTIESSQDNDTRTKNARIILELLFSEIFIGYNSLTYDLPVLMLILKDFDTTKVYKLSKYIVSNNLNYYDILKKLESIKFQTAIGDKVSPFHFTKTHIDLERFNKGGFKLPLKVLGARMNYPKLESLPFDPDKEVSAEQIKHLKEYCEHDVNITITLAKKYKKSIDVRLNLMGKYPNHNLMTKRDSQVSSTIMLDELGLKKEQVDKNNFEWLKEGYVTEFTYDIADYISFKSKVIMNQVKAIAQLPFTATIKKNKEGKFSSILKSPDLINPYEPKIKGKSYTIRSGGIHAITNKVFTSSFVMDSDVVSYYPNLMASLRIAPKIIAEAGLIDKLKFVIDDLLLSKQIATDEGDVESKANYKIILNNLYGHLGNPYSPFYDPKAMIQVTLTGQFALLMLIEELSNNGFEILNANTDGILVDIKDQQRKQEYLDITSNWEKTTGLKLTHDSYAKALIKDTNNYILQNHNNIRDLSLKANGCFKRESLDKHLIHHIVFKAVYGHFLFNIDPKETITNEYVKLTDFIILAGVAKDNYITDGKNNYGRYARFIWSHDIDNAVTLKDNKRQDNISRGDSVIVLNEVSSLEGVFASSYRSVIDFKRYIDEANLIINALKKGGKKGVLKAKREEKEITDRDFLYKDIDAKLHELRTKGSRDIKTKMLVEYEKLEAKINTLVLKSIERVKKFDAKTNKTKKKETT